MPQSDYDNGWYAGYHDRPNAGYNARYRAGYQSGWGDRQAWFRGHNDYLAGYPRSSPECSYYYQGYDTAQQEFNQGYYDARACYSRNLNSQAYEAGYIAGCNQNYWDGYNDIYFHSLAPQRTDSERYDDGYNQGWSEAWQMGYAHAIAGYATDSNNHAYLTGYNSALANRISYTVYPNIVFNNVIVSCQVRR